MTDAPQHPFPVPASLPMAAVFGPADEFLRLIDNEIDGSVHLRGNVVTVSGSPADAAFVERLLDEIVAMVRTGQGVTSDLVERSIAMLRAETSERPADVLSLKILSNRGRT